MLSDPVSPQIYESELDRLDARVDREVSRLQAAHRSPALPHMGEFNAAFERLQHELFKVQDDIMTSIGHVTEGAASENTRLVQQRDSGETTSGEMARASDRQNVSDIMVVDARHTIVSQRVKNVEILVGLSALCTV